MLSRFNITQQERLVLIFSLSLALLGLSINLCIKYLPAIKRFPQRAFYETTSKKKLDINQASKDDFIKLPGIGPVIAERIIQYRNTHTKFKSLDELNNVQGIGEEKFKKFKRYLTIK